MQELRDSFLSFNIPTLYLHHFRGPLAFKSNSGLSFFFQSRPLLGTDTHRKTHTHQISVGKKSQLSQFLAKQPRQRRVCVCVCVLVSKRKRAFVSYGALESTGKHLPREVQRQRTQQSRMNASGRRRGEGRTLGGLPCPLPPSWLGAVMCVCVCVCVWPGSGERVR